MRGILCKPTPKRRAGRHAQTMFQARCRRGFSCILRSRAQPVSRLFRPSFVPTMPVGIGALPPVVRMPFSFSLLPNISLNGTAGERGSFSLAFGRLPVSFSVSRQ